MPVTIDTDLPLHDDRSRSWDGDAARSAMAQRCATDDGVMADCMGRGFIWRDPEADAATIGAYDLPVADVFDGDLHLVLSGVQAAANSISPEREPGSARALDAPESDLSRMRSAVETILARFARHFDDEEIRAPWESETAAADPNDEDDEGDEERRRRNQTTYASAGCGCDCGQRPKPSEHDQDSPTEEKAMSETTTAPTAAPRSRVLRASATGGEWRPPVEHFANPHMAEPTKLTVTADGRVYGHLATWDQPHIGYDGKLVYPPRNASGEYEYFRQSRVVTADGSALAVGLITMATGHADDNLAADAAAAHYDNTGTMVAAVNIGEDQHGIWLAGSMLPDVSPEQRARFSLARVSGDWRQPRPGAGLELIAALSVPNPGFPVRQPAELLAADRLTLAASGARIDPSIVRFEEGQVRTFITAGADVVDQARAAEITDAVNQALAGPLAEQIRTAVSEALAARDEAAKQAVPEAEPTPTPEGEPAPEGEVAPVAPAAPAEAAASESAPAAPEAAQAPAEEAGAPAAGAGTAPPEEVVPANTVPAPAPAAPAEAAVEPNPQGVAASSALRARMQARRAHSARQRLLAAAGGRSKKA